MRWFSSLEGFAQVGFVHRRRVDRQWSVVNTNLRYYLSKAAIYRKMHAINFPSTCPTTCRQVKSSFDNEERLLDLGQAREASPPLPVCRYDADTIILGRLVLFHLLSSSKAQREVLFDWRLSAELLMEIRIGRESFSSPVGAVTKSWSQNNPLEPTTPTTSEWVGAKWLTGGGSALFFLRNGGESDWRRRAPPRIVESEIFKARDISSGFYFV